MTTEIVILALLWSIPVFSFLYIPSCALVAEWTPSSIRGKGLGLISSSVGVSQVIGAVTGGTLTRYLCGGFDAFIFAFRFSLIFILIGLILAALFLPSKVATPDKKGNEP
jgi:MFS family permease